MVHGGGDEVIQDKEQFVRHPGNIIEAWDLTVSGAADKEHAGNICFASGKTRSRVLLMLFLSWKVSITLYFRSITMNGVSWSFGVDKST